MLSDASIHLVAVDPGLYVSGIALFVGDTLKRADLVRSSAMGLSPIAIWAEMARMIRSQVLAFLREREQRHRCVVVEIPQVYSRGTKGDPNDLIQIAGVSGAIAGCFVDEIFSIHSYLPAQWKKQVPKKIMVERVKSRLTYEEHQAVAVGSSPPSLHHNIWDAVGIGLHHLKRL